MTNRTTQSTAPYEGPGPAQVVPAKHVEGMPPNNHPEDNTEAYEKGESMAGAEEEGEDLEDTVEGGEGEDTTEGGEGEDTTEGGDTLDGGDTMEAAEDTI